MGKPTMKMTDNNMPSPDEGKPEIETPTPNEEQGTPSPNPESAPSVEPTPNEPDYKTSYGESTRENQLLREQLRLRDERIAELTKPHNPTEQELREEFPEWDTMLPHEKRLATSNLAMRREIKASKETQAKLLAEKQWEKDLKTVTKKFPQLKGREDEFETFVFKPTHQGVPVETLAKSFLFDTSTPPAPKAPTGERGSGGPKPENVGPKKYTSEELSFYRKNDYKKYLEIVKSGNYEMDV